MVCHSLLVVLGLNMKRRFVLKVERSSNSSYWEVEPVVSRKAGIKGTGV